jgi:hypothetical protein
MAGAPQPTWFGRMFVKTFRTLFVTFLFTLFGMGVGLMAGILWYVIGGAVSGVHPDMRLAYRHVAIFVAMGFGLCALLYQLFLEKRTAPRPR